MKDMFKTEEKTKEVFRDLDNNLGGISVSIGTLAGAERFLYGLVNDLELVVHRGTAEYSAKEISLKLSAVYELIKFTLGELHEHEKEAIKSSEEAFHHFTIKNKTNNK